MKTQKNILKLAAVAALALTLGACSSYNHKDYPRESWFKTGSQLIEAEQFQKAENPLKVVLVVNYTWEGRPIVQEPFEDRPADWREQYGLWEATKRYLQQTGQFVIVDEDNEEKQGVMTVDLSRWMDEETKKAIAAKEADPQSHPEKIVYEYDMTMKMSLNLLQGKALSAAPATDHMWIGHEDSEKRKVGLEPKRFTFSYFNNMDFHTEFVRRFYKQMVFEGVKEMDDKGLSALLVPKKEQK